MIATLRQRNFALLWLGGLISNTGDWLLIIGLPVYVYLLTGSALATSITLITAYVPNLVFGSVAGVFVDRFDRKRIMIASDLLRAALAFLIPVLVPYNIAWLYVIVLLSSSIGQFFDPAQASVLPEVATDDELAAANSLMAISSFGSTAVGFAASGLIASQFSIDWAFYIDGATFLFSAGSIALLHLATFKTEEDTKVSTIIRNMKSGFQFLLGKPILRSMFIMFPVVGISFGLWNTLLLPFARQALGVARRLPRRRPGPRGAGWPRCV